MRKGLPNECQRDTETMFQGGSNELRLGRLHGRPDLVGRSRPRRRNCEVPLEMSMFDSRARPKFANT